MCPTVRGEEVIVQIIDIVVVAGPLSQAVARTVRDRFADVRVTASGSHTVIQCSLRDQSALRALLTQLWDVGAEVLLVSHAHTHIPRSHHGQANH
jgi:hypothetical protein